MYCLFWSNGAEKLGIVKEKRDNKDIAKQNNTTLYLKDISYHYREEHKEMMRKRADGVRGYLEFIGWT